MRAKRERGGVMSAVFWGCCWAVGMIVLSFALWMVRTKSSMHAHI